MILASMQKSIQLNFFIVVEALSLFCLAEVCCCTFFGDLDCDLM